MKIAILADRLELLNIKKDSTYAMMQEAAARGHALHVFEQQHLHCEGGVVSANAARARCLAPTKAARLSLSAWTTTLRCFAKRWRR